MTSTDDKPEPQIKRRGFVTVSLAAVGGAIVGAGATWGGISLLGGDSSTEKDKKKSKKSSEDEDDEISLGRYVSTELTLPVIAAWAAKGATPAPGYTFLSPRDDVFTAAIIDNSGEPVWIAPYGVDSADVRVQTYQGAPVITYWEGRVMSGNGHGTGRILDSHYREIAAVHAGNGALADLHEFHLTDRDTALITTYPVERRDLSAVGGPEDGYVFACRVQEIDVATGKVLLDWNILDHIALDETKKRIEDDDEKTGTSPDNVYDPIHVNSIEDDGDRLIISCRHTCAVYAIGRSSGELLWRLGGTQSDFEMGKDTDFSWQHDSRWHGDGTLSLFDNAGVSGDDAVSSALVLHLDEEKMTAEKKMRYSYGEYVGYAMGNTQLLEGGHVMVGWGSAPSATEFDADGTAIGGFTEIGNGSYRTYRCEWAGEPLAKPAVATMTSDGEPTAYMSWNGATRVASWALLGGADASSLAEVAAAERDGFETAIAIPDAASVTVIQVEARDANGAALARSAIVAAT